MRERFWGDWAGGEARVFSEKAYRRRSLAAWDAKWQQLTVQARYSFLHSVKLPDKIPNRLRQSAERSTRQLSACTSWTNWPPPVSSGSTSLRSAATVDRVFAGVGTNDFAWRGRILRRMHLLDADQPE